MDVYYSLLQSTALPTELSRETGITKMCKVLYFVLSHDHAHDVVSINFIFLINFHYEMNALSITLRVREKEGGYVMNA